MQKGNDDDDKLMQLMAEKQINSSNAVSLSLSATFFTGREKEREIRVWGFSLKIGENVKEQRKYGKKIEI